MKRHSIPLLHLLLIAFVIVTSAAAQTATKEANEVAATENWFGVLDVKVMKLRLLLEVTAKPDGGHSAVLTSVDQGNAKIPVDEITVEDGNLTFSIQKIDASFEGTLSGDEQSIKGTFTQVGVDRPLSFKKTDGVPVQTLVAAWVGDLQAGPQTLRVQVRELETEDGQREVLFDSLTQRTSGISATMEIEGTEVNFAAPGIKAKFEGTLNEDKTQIDGTWTQMGTPLKLRLTKVDKAETEPPRNRPQTPKEPFSYNSEEVEFQNKEQNVTLGGTLTTPKEGAPHPCVVMITGSGPQDRDETIFGHKPFAVIADYLAGQGIATLRYDDRGIGDSTGSFAKATSADFAKDAAAAVEYLKQRDEIDSSSIGLVGHSEGGLISTILAAERDDLAHVVLMAGPGVSGDRIIIDQTVAIWKVANASDDHLAEQNEMMKELVAAATSESLDKETLNAIIKKYPKAGSQNDDSMLATQLQQFTSPWFKFFLKYDPAPDLEKAKCPVLALIGEKDLQVTTGLNVPAIEAALKKAGQPGSKLVELEGLNHLFQPCETGSPGEYDTIEQTIDPEVLELIAAWVNEHQAIKGTQN